MKLENVKVYDLEESLLFLIELTSVNDHLDYSYSSMWKTIISSH